MLHIDHARDQDAGIADDHPSRLEHQRTAEIMRHPLDHRGIGRRQRRRLAVHVIGNAEAAAEIDMRDGVAVGAQHLHEFGQQPERGFQRPEIGDLAADMHVDAGDLDPRQLCRAGIDRAGMNQRDAELVLGLAGRDFCVRTGIDVGVDPNRDPRDPARLGGEPRQQFEFGLGFDVDAENVRRQRRAQFGLGLADPREQDLVRRKARGQRPLQLAAGNHVGAGAELRQRAQHRLIGIGLHGVADQRLLVGEGLAEHPVMALQGRGRIAIERRADRIRQFDKIDRLGVKHAVAIVEVIHGELSPAADRERRISGALWARWALRRRSD